MTEDPSHETAVPTTVVLAWPDHLLDLADRLSDLSSEVYIVGGAVRDAYLRLPIKDLDLVTAGSGTRLARTIANLFNGAYYPLDEERDVGRALIEIGANRLEIDAASLRGGDLLADLSDRDFTMNALAVMLAGDLQHVIDPMGGIADLRAKRLRRCNPSSIANDPIRALRAVRQSAQFALRIDPATLADVRAASPRIRESSPERVRDEVFKSLALPKPAAAIRVMELTGLLDAALPIAAVLRERGWWLGALLTCERLAQIWQAIGPQRSDTMVAQFGLGMLMMQIDRYRGHLQERLWTVYGADRGHRAVTVLGALLYQLDSQQIVETCARLKLSNEEKSVLLGMAEHWQAADRGGDRLSAHRFWKTARAAGIDALLVALAHRLREPTRVAQDDWLRSIETARSLLEAYFTRFDEIVAPPPLLDGRQLQNQLGLTPGPLIGELLDALQALQAEGRVQTAEQALEEARRILKERPGADPAALPRADEG